METPFGVYLCINRSALMTVAGERVAARLRDLAFGSMVFQETSFFDRNR